MTQIMGMSGGGGGIRRRWKGKGVLVMEPYEMLEDDDDDDGDDDGDHGHNGGTARRKNRQHKKVESKNKRMWDTFLADGIGSIAALYFPVSDLSVVSEMVRPVGNIFPDEEGLLLHDL